MSTGENEKTWWPGLTQIQFPRLLCEIVAAQEDLDLPAIAASMDLEVHEVYDLLDRAVSRWEQAKAESCVAVSASQFDNIGSICVHEDHHGILDESGEVWALAWVRAGEGNPANGSKDG